MRQTELHPLDSHRSDHQDVRVSPWKPGDENSLEAVAVLQVEHQTVSTQVHFVLGLRHLQVKHTPFSELKH